MSVWGLLSLGLSCGGENSAVLTARAWVEDSEATECMACKSPFTFVNRKVSRTVMRCEVDVMTCDVDLDHH